MELNEVSPKEVFDLLKACDEFCLEETIDHIQDFLLEKHKPWIKTNFFSIHRLCSEFKSFAKLENYCNELICERPATILKAQDLSIIEKSQLISLLRRDDLSMDEIEIWECVINWALTQLPIRLDSSDVSKWSSENIEMFKSTLNGIIQHVRFAGISSSDFYKKVKPYAKILGEELYEDILQYYLDDDWNSGSKSFSKLPGRKCLHSCLITKAHTSLIASWIDRKEFSYDIRSNPYEFILCLRGSLNGFAPAIFHDLCDNQGPTITGLFFH